MLLKNNIKIYICRETNQKNGLFIKRQCRETIMACASRNGVEIVHWSSEYWKGLHVILSHIYSLTQHWDPRVRNFRPKAGHKKTKTGWDSFLCSQEQLRKGTGMNKTLPTLPSHTTLLATPPSSPRDGQRNEQKIGQQGDIFITTVWRTRGKCELPICAQLYNFKVML